MNSQANGLSDITSNTEKPSLPKKCKLIGIYGLRNKVNGKWYVGQSWDMFSPQWTNRYKNLWCRSQHKIYNAIKKYGYDSFEKISLEQCNENITQKFLDSKEVSWIRQLNSIANGYNIAGGGRGGKLSEDTKLKIKESWKVRRLTPVSEETRKKQSISALGKKKSPRTLEQRKHMSDAQKGKSQSPETIKKRSDAVRLTWKLRGGRSFTEEHCKKISDNAKMRYTNPKKHPNYKNGQRTNPSKLAQQLLPNLHHSTYSGCSI